MKLLSTNENHLYKWLDFKIIFQSFYLDDFVYVGKQLKASRFYDTNRNDKNYVKKVQRNELN